MMDLFYRNNSTVENFNGELFVECVIQAHHDDFFLFRVLCIILPYVYYICTVVSCLLRV
jgi:hypothetical protein